jgi:hypothetical protein
VARLDLYRRPGGLPGYLLDVQAAVLAWMPTRVVVPIVAEADIRVAERSLNYRISICGAPHVLFPQGILSIERRRLGEPVLTLSPFEPDIHRALDYLFFGI